MHKTTLIVMGLLGCSVFFAIPALAANCLKDSDKLVPGFTSRYNITHLVYFEVTQDIHAALAREKQIKGWVRRRKIALVESTNPEWKDLSSGWYEGRDFS